MRHVCTTLYIAMGAYGTQRKERVSRARLIECARIRLALLAALGGCAMTTTTISTTEPAISGNCARTLLNSSRVPVNACEKLALPSQS